MILFALIDAVPVLDKLTGVSVLKVSMDNPIPFWVNQGVSMGVLACLAFFAPRRNPFLMVGHALEKHTWMRHLFAVPIGTFVIGLMMLAFGPFIAENYQTGVPGFIIRCGLFGGGLLAVLIVAISPLPQPTCPTSYPYSEPPSYTPTATATATATSPDGTVAASATAGGGGKAATAAVPEVTVTIADTPENRVAMAKVSESLAVDQKAGKA